MFNFPTDLRDVLNEPNTQWFPYIEKNIQYFKTITKIDICGRNLVVEIHKIKMCFGHTTVEHSCYGGTTRTIMDCEFVFEPKDGEFMKAYWEDCNKCKCKCCEVCHGN